MKMGLCFILIVMLYSARKGVCSFVHLSETMHRGASPTHSLSSPDLTFSLWEGTVHEEVMRPLWPCPGTPATLGELVCAAAFRQL